MLARLNSGVPVGAVIVIALLLLAPQILPWMAHRLMPSPKATIANGLELTAFIEKVKADLERAERDGVAKGERPLLQLQDVELVVNFVVQSRAETDVKLVTVNGSAISGEERTQKITLHLKPVPPETVKVAPSAGPIVASPGRLLGERVPPGPPQPKVSP